MKSNLVDIEARLVHETEKAWLLDFGGEDPVWVPKSVGEFDGKELTVPQSFAELKGLV